MKILVISMLFIFSAVSFGQWSPQVSGSGIGFSTIQFFDQNNGWALGSGGSVRTTDAGQTWSMSGSTIGLKKISIVDQNTAYAIVGDKSIYVTTNGGTTWIPKSSPYVTSLSGLHFISTTTGFAGGQNGYIFKTTNGGNSWIDLTGGHFYVSDLYFSDDNNGWACRWGGQWSRTTDGGANWTTGSLGSEYFYTVYGIGSGIAFVGGENGKIHKTTNGGTTWTSLPTGVSSTIYDICVLDQQIWAAGSDGVIIHSTNGGNSWSTEVSGTSAPLAGIYFLDENTGWACGSGGTILKHSGTPSINLTSPVGGENLQAGSTHNITWVSSGISNVKLEYSTNNGVSWVSIISSVSAASLSYSWTIPQTASNQCLVKVSDAENVSLNDISDNTFIISIPNSIVLTSPSGGENLQAGSIHSISWTSSGVSNVKLEYSTDSGASWLTIISSYSAAISTYNWTVPQATSTQCLVKVSDAAVPSLSDASDNTFTIFIPKSLVLTSPNGGEYWRSGSVQNINWLSTGINDVKIEYTSDNGVTWQIITLSTPAAASSYAWILPDIESVYCRVRISDASDLSINYLSNSVFSIFKKSITLTSPNGGENWRAGSSQNIIWSRSGFSSVKVELSSDNGNTWIIIDTSVTAPEGISYTVPATASSVCRIKVSDRTDPSVFAISANTFRIFLPALTLTSPNGGEKLRPETVSSITWTNTDIENVKLEFSSNNGSTWIHIASSTPAAAGSFLWTVPVFYSAACLIRISDVSDSTINDSSNSTFEIFHPTISLISPDGGENWASLTSHNITWTAEYISTVKLEYTTDNGESWLSITESADGSKGSFVWIIPDINSNSCRVKISDSSDPSTADQSSEVFTVYRRTISLNSPDGGEMLITGKIHTITWTKSGFSNVKVEYSTNNGSSWIVIDSNATGGGIQWIIPNTPSANCRIRVSDRTEASVNDLSTDVFTIAIPAITILSPNGNESWRAGTIKISSGAVLGLILSKFTLPPITVFPGQKSSTEFLREQKVIHGPCRN